MRFLEVEQSIRSDSWTMQDLHSHPHYELYYIYKGSRQLLLANALHHIEAPSMIVIPPNVMHKTEGGPFERYNVDVSPEYLNPFQLHVLNERALRVMKLTQTQNQEFLPLLREMAETDNNLKYSRYIVEGLFAYFVVALSRVDLSSQPGLSVEHSVPPLVLKVIDYLYAHYREKLTLDGLAQRFFVSKATIIYNFNRYLHCSPMDFLLNLRMTKAKEELLKTDKSICQIAEECGFRSANYFSLIFKRKEQLSPGNYRKYQRTKT